VPSEIRNHKLLKESIRDTVQLTAADCFMLALDRKHIMPTGHSSNTCHYVLELDGVLDRDAFDLNVNAHPDLRWLASVKPVKRFPFSIPVWRAIPDPKKIPVNSFFTDELLPEHILNARIVADSPPLLRFDILYRSNKTSALVFSWHHLLMDGYGATLLLRQLAGQQPWPRLALDVVETKINSRFPFAAATRAKFFVDRSAKKPLSTISPRKPDDGNQKIRIVKLSAEETAQIDQAGITVGAMFGRSALYLAAASSSVYTILKNRGQVVNDFWIPVPRDQRKKGAVGPIIGNHISFLLYRLSRHDLPSLSKTVRSINHQMINHIKKRTQADYDILMEYLRRTPQPLYYYWIKGPQGGSLSSFLFTVAADHPDDFTSFNGHAIMDAWSFPSNIHPPGLTFAFMRYRDNLHLMISYFDDVITPTELDALERQLKHELTTGTNLSVND
jgi:hypothetical protein